jgi:hypothetical protein
LGSIVWLAEDRLVTPGVVRNPHVGHRQPDRVTTPAYTGLRIVDGEFQFDSMLVLE